MIIQLSLQLYTYYSNETVSGGVDLEQVFEPGEQEQIYSLKSLILEQSYDLIRIITSNNQSNTLTVNQSAYLNSIEQIANWTIDCENQYFCQNILEEQTEETERILVIINSIIQNWIVTTQPTLKLIFINCTIINFQTTTEFTVEFYNSTIQDSTISSLANDSIFYSCLINNTQFQQQFQLIANYSKFINIQANQTQFILNNSIITNSTLEQVQIGSRSVNSQIKYNRINIQQSLVYSSNEPSFGMLFKGNQINISQQVSYLFDGSFQNLTNFTFILNEVNNTQDNQQFYLINEVRQMDNLTIRSNQLPQTLSFALIQKCVNASNSYLESDIFNRNVQQIFVIEQVGDNTNTSIISDMYIKINYNIIQEASQQGRISPFNQIQLSQISTIYLEENIQLTAMNGQMGSGQQNQSINLSLLAQTTQYTNLSNIYVTGNVKVINKDATSLTSLHFTFLQFQNVQTFSVNQGVYDLNTLDLQYVNDISLIPNQTANITYTDSIFQVNQLHLIYNNTPITVEIGQNISYQTKYGYNLSGITATGYQEQSITHIQPYKYNEEDFEFQMQGAVTTETIDDHIQARVINNTLVTANNTIYGLCSYCYEFIENVCQLSDNCTVNETQWLNMTSYTKQSCVSDQTEITLDHIELCVMGTFQCEQGYGGQYCNYELDSQESDLQEQILNRTQYLQQVQEINMNETNNNYNQIVNDLINITSQLGITQPDPPEQQLPDSDNVTQAISMETYMQNINTSLFQIAQNATREQNPDYLQGYQIQSLQQLQNELQQLLEGVSQLAGEDYNEHDLTGTIQSILTKYQEIFQNALEICQNLDVFLFNGTKQGMQEAIEQLFDQYYRAEFGSQWWQELLQNCTTYNQQHSITNNTCDDYIQQEIIANLPEINDQADQLAIQISQIQTQINEQRQRQLQLLEQERQQQQEITQMNQQILDLQQQIADGEGEYNKSKNKSDITMYVMIVVIVLTVAINVALCLVYHCCPKYQQNKDIKKRLQQIEKSNQQQDDKDDDKDSQDKGYRQVPKHLPQLKNKKQETIIEETAKTINTVLSATQLTPQQKLKYAEEQLKLEKGKHQEIYQGEKIDIDKNIIGVLQRTTQLQPQENKDTQTKIQKIKKDVVL